MRIAVTGGTGFIGSHVVEELLQAGHEVSCLVLPKEGPGWIADKKVSFFEGSVLERESLAPFLEGCDAIVHLAGLTRANSEAEFIAVNAEGARNIIEAALSLPKPPRQIIAMSSLAATGPSNPDGTCIDEEAELRPITPYGRSKAALEQTVCGYKGRIEYTFIRAPGVYGPRDKDFLHYFRLVRKGFRVIIGPRNVLSLLYVKNLAAAISSCILNPAAYRQAFFIADDGVYDWDDFSELVEKSLSKKTKRIQIPTWAVHVASFGTMLAKPFLKSPPLVTRNKIKEMKQPCWIVSTEKAKRLLGFTPVVSTETAMRNTTQWYLDNGWI
mgnify:CR=1 FL=1